MEARTRRYAGWIVGIATGLLLIWFASPFRPLPLAQESAPAPTAAQIVTIDGNDGTGGTIDPVNVWDNYQTRGAVVARLHPGDKVTLIQRTGNGVRIETPDGTRGWVTYAFIKELR